MEGKAEASLEGAQKQQIESDAANLLQESNALFDSLSPSPTPTVKDPTAILDSLLDSQPSTDSTAAVSALLDASTANGTPNSTTEVSPLLDGSPGDTASEISDHANEFYTRAICLGRAADRFEIRQRPDSPWPRETNEGRGQKNPAGVADTVFPFITRSRVTSRLCVE
jgi:hypothetical protein